MRRKILFISHESSLTGGTILLINLIRLIINDNLFDVSIIVKRGGKLDSTFKELGTTVILKPEGYQLNKSFGLKVYDFLLFKWEMRKALQEAKDADIIFSNTVTNGRLLKALDFLKKPTIVYVHELAYVLEFYNQHFDSRHSLNLADVIFSPAKAVSRNLIHQFKINPDKIFPLNYYYSSSYNYEKTTSTHGKSQFRDKYKIPLKRFHVVGMGAAVERKGFDLFISICKNVIAQDPTIHFTWIGDYLNKEFGNKMSKVISEYNLDAHLTITGYVPHDPGNLRDFDLLALTSREDPYPLVVLEAAFLKIPAVAFSKTGGIEDFIGNDAGFMVDELSAEAMALQILELSRNKEQIRDYGERARKKVIALHSSSDLVLQQLWAGINMALSKH